MPHPQFPEASQPSVSNWRLAGRDARIPDHRVHGQGQSGGVSQIARQSCHLKTESPGFRSTHLQSHGLFRVKEIRT